MEFYAVGTQKFEVESVNASGKKEKSQGEKTVLITFEDILPKVDSRLRAENVARAYAKLNKITGIQVYPVQGKERGGSVMPSGKNKLANRIKAQRKAESTKANKGKKK